MVPDRSAVVAFSAADSAACEEEACVSMSAWELSCSRLTELPSCSQFPRKRTYIATHGERRGNDKVTHSEISEYTMDS